MTAQTPATVADILGELVDALEAAVLRLRDREDMRAILPGDINQTLALELGVMVSEVEQIARPAIDNAQTFIASAHTALNTENSEMVALSLGRLA